jgi:ribosomal protein S18 acetylase RimI-like enzyme
MRLRIMTEADIPAGMRLKEISGWNQTPEDWERFLNVHPNGCFLAEVDSRVVGTAATIPYEGKFAWIGMVLVDPEYRGRGIGTRLLEKAIGFLDEGKIPTMKLDATPLGKPLYEKLGFVTEYEIERLALNRDPEQLSNLEPTNAQHLISSSELEIVMARDAELFGADRSGLLKSLHRESPELISALWNAGKLIGYVFGRKGSFADHLGPLMATDAETCQKLVAAFLRGSSREKLIVDCLKSAGFGGDMLRQQGFHYSRTLTRMFRGENRFPGKHGELCAILGPEFG